MARVIYVLKRTSSTFTLYFAVSTLTGMSSSSVFKQELNDAPSNSFNELMSPNVGVIVTGFQRLIIECKKYAEAVFCNRARQLQPKGCIKINSNVAVIGDQVNLGKLVRDFERRVQELGVKRLQVTWSLEMTKAAVVRVALKHVRRYEKVITTRLR
ncbi:hypothetical protein Cgig2_006824 [Carnegiea gigantea]|uniref:Uncharacterized protein n=1 Tax=Carnegiea gigantea TaxID=171969 RepID=A0A9Q1JQA7_9CARY|nr:hypothetical protein Cgig2_006824 [Carnegiea gigantea]